MKSINSINTGQGEAIFKSASTLLTSIGVLKTDDHPECDYVLASGDKKVLSLIFSAKIDALNEFDITYVKPELGSEEYFEHLKSKLGYLCAEVSEVKQMDSTARYASSNSNNFYPLKLKQPALTTIALRIGVDENCGVSSKTPPDAPVALPIKPVLWSDTIPIAQNGTDFELPIPKARAFGKRTFAVTLDGAGAITALQYAKEAGVSQMINSSDAVLKALSGKSTADRALEIKAEADLILQQQRLVTCLADNANCK